MLRGVNASGVPLVGTRFIDILLPVSLPIVKDASGDMVSPLGMPARDQVPGGLCGGFTAHMKSNSRPDVSRHTRGSQFQSLQAQHERVTKGLISAPPVARPR